MIPFHYILNYIVWRIDIAMTDTFQYPVYYTLPRPRSNKYRVDEIYTVPIFMEPIALVYASSVGHEQ